jgi:hypothetical protein
MGKKKRIGKCFVIGLIVLFLLIMVFFFTINKKVNFSPEETEKTIAPEIKDKDNNLVLSSEDMTKISLIRQNIIEDNLYDYSEMHDVIITKKGDLKRIIAVCDLFDGAPEIFCLRDAAYENSELRTQICEKLFNEIKINFEGKSFVDKLAEGHKKECLLGIRYRVVG